MIDLEELSFRNRVEFFSKELKELHRSKTLQKINLPCLLSNRWKEIYEKKFIRIMSDGGCSIALTSKTIAVLCGLWELDDIDKDRNSTVLGEYLNGIKSI